MLDDGASRDLRQPLLLRHVSLEPEETVGRQPRRGRRWPPRHRGAARLPRPPAGAASGSSRIIRSTSSCRRGARGRCSPNALEIREEPLAARKILVTIDDVTERKRASEALEAARRVAEQANLGKSRFLAAASHDLRQPLQTLSLLRGILAKRIKDQSGSRLVAKLEETLSAMSGMLNTLLDINQLEAGIVRPEIVEFPIGTVLDRLRTEFAYHVTTKQLGWRVVASGLNVRSDPRLLEQMLRNLLCERGEIYRAGQGPARLPPARRQAAHRGVGHRDRHSRGTAEGDLRGVPSARQRRPRAQPRPRPGSFHRATHQRSAGPRHRCPLLAGPRVGVRHRGAARRGPAAAAERAGGRAAIDGPHRRDPDRRGRSRGARDARDAVRGTRDTGRPPSPARTRRSQLAARGAIACRTSSSPTTTCRGI